MIWIMSRGISGIVSTDRYVHLLFGRADNLMYSAKQMDRDIVNATG